MPPFTQLTAFGLSVRGARTSLGWGTDQFSTLELELVQDPKNGDSPNFPPVGTPAYFQFYNLTFNGLFQKYARKQDVSGDPVFEAVCVDPRAILGGTQLILGAYNGASVIPNVLNVFGYYEQTLGFGAAQANESGMPWANILQGILDLTGGATQTPFGGPLLWNGVAYSLDLSQLPATPPFYRIGGVTANLLEVIAQVCQDGACDFFVQLRGYTIVVRTVSRLSQPPLGTISALTTADLGTSLIRSESGVEARSDNIPNSVLLLGGDVTNLHLSANILSFWGYDVNGNPITGVPGTFTFKDSNGKALGTVAGETMSLNAEGVEDVVGAVTYQTNTVELRAALAGYDSWSAYIESYRTKDIAPLIFPVLRNPGGPGAAIKPKLVNDDRAAALLLAQNAINTDFLVKSQKLFDFVLRHAQEYYGRQFLVGVPFVLTSQDAETGVISTSLAPADAAWYSEDLPPLNLPELKADILRVEDGRYRCFVEYDLNPNVQANLGLDLSNIPPAESLLANNSLYMLAGVNGGLVYNPAPYALVSLQGAVFEKAADFQGGPLAPGILNLNGGDQAKANLSAFGNVGVKLWPAAHYPITVAVPLKSNVLTYGPWFATGAQGPAAVEHDPTLVPWNYGGEAAMETAASQRVVNAFSDMTVSEAGLVELAGPPSYSLGDTLQANGPNLTNISVSFGPQGVTTTYRMQTFTPRFGVFSKFSAERVRRLGLVNQQLKRALRQVINQNIERAETVQRAAVAGLRGFMQNAPKALKKQSPHETLFSYSFQETNGDVRVGVSAATYEEAFAGVAEILDTTQARDGNYLSAAAMSLAGLLHPYATVPGSGGMMPCFLPPTQDFNSVGLNSSTLNPIPPGNDVEVYLWHDTYQGMHAYRRGAGEDARALALKGPLVLSSWGFDLNGSPVPTQDGQNFYPNYLKRSDQWAAGPMDPYWDPSRGVWTSHDVLQGMTGAGIDPGGSGLVTVYNNQNPTALQVWAYNRSGHALPCGRVGVAFLAHSRNWMVFPDGPLDFWAKITGSSGSAYSWQEVDDPNAPSPPSRWVNDGGAGNFNAEEVNGYLVPAGTIVRMWPNPDKCGWYAFSYCCGSQSPSSSLSSGGAGSSSGGSVSHSQSGSSCTSYEVVVYTSCDPNNGLDVKTKYINIPNGLGITLTDSPAC